MAENTSLDKPPSPFEIIMSCSICQKLISDIYRHPETNSLRDGTDNLIITKLWLTECAHLTCSQHLEGGGPPFHREGEQPKAPCPMCTAERGDRKPKRLYGIRGKADDEHDEAIPGNWFQTPPMDLGPGMEAFRFQYLSLIKYGTMITRRFREALNSREQYKVQLINVTNDRASLEQEMNGLKLRVKDLEETEAKWLRYKKREPSVTHYLSIVSDIANENALLKQQLVSLGYKVPQTNYAFKGPNESGELTNNEDTSRRNFGTQRPATRSSPTRQGTPKQQNGSSWSRTLLSRGAGSYHGNANDSGSPVRKRKYQQIQEDVEPQIYARQNSREKMPPPPLPPSRTELKARDLAHGTFVELTQHGQQHLDSQTYSEAMISNVELHDDRGRQEFQNRPMLAREEHPTSFKGRNAEPEPLMSGPFQLERDHPDDYRWMKELRGSLSASNGIRDQYEVPGLIQDPRILHPDRNVGHLPSTPSRVQQISLPPPGMYVKPDHLGERRYNTVGSLPLDSTLNSFSNNRNTTVYRPHSRYQNDSVAPNPAHRRPPISQRFNVSSTAPSYRNPRSLNGLSFIEEPYDVVNEPLLQSSTRSRMYSGLTEPSRSVNPHVDGNGIFHRSEIPPSSHIRSGAPAASPRDEQLFRAVPDLPSSTPSVYQNIPPTLNGGFSNIRDGRISFPVRSTAVSQRRMTEPIRRDDKAPSRGLFSSTGGRRVVRR